MNVLIFVITMIMVLSIMTYARIDSFRDFAGLKAQFEWYMQEYERGFANKAADKKYLSQNASKKKKEDDGAGKQKDEESSSSKLPINLLFNKQMRESQHDSYDQQVLLLKALIQQVYGDKTFYKDAEEQRPDIVDATLQNLTNAADKLPKNFVTIAPDIASINLGSEPYETFLHRILRGTVKIDEQDKALTYPSLLDYITVKNKSKIRIYLASHDLLMAIYDNEGVVKEIEDLRNQLYKQVKDKDIEPEDATHTFKEQIGGKQRQGVDEKLLSFKVTKTNPKDYN